MLWTKLQRFPMKALAALALDVKGMGANFSSALLEPVVVLPANFGPAVFSPGQVEHIDTVGKSGENC